MRFHGNQGVLFHVFLAGISGALFAAQLSPSDSLGIQLFSGSEIRYNQSGMKAAEIDLFHADYIHQFNRTVSAAIALRQSRSLPETGIERGEIVVETPGYLIAAGATSTRLGKVVLYDPASVFNPLFDQAILWDSYGFGLRSGFFGKSAAAIIGGSINNKENGSAFGVLSMKSGRFSGCFLSGIQTYTVENQDNALKAGFELAWSGACIMLHSVGAFTRYTGYGHATNSTMVPGNLMQGFVETRIRPVRAITITGLCYFKEFRKRFDHSELFYGTTADWMVSKRQGIGFSYESSISDAMVFNTAQLYYLFIPYADHTRITSGIKQDFSPDMYKGFATVWFDF